MRADRERGQRIRMARLQAGLSLRRACGDRLSRTHVSRVERGTHGISADLLIYLADRLGTTVTEFLAEGCDPEDLKELIEAGERLERKGEFSHAAAIYGDVLPRIPADRLDVAAWCHIRLGAALRQLQQYDVAMAHQRQGLSLAECTAETYLIAWAHNGLGLGYLAQGNYRDGLIELETALGLIRTHPRPKRLWLVRILTNLGQALMRLGRDREALEYVDEAMRFAVAAGDRLVVGMVARNAASVLIGLGRYGEAQQHLEEAMRCFTEAHRPDLVATVENGLGILLIKLGMPDRAISHLERAVRIQETNGDDHRRAYNLTELARAHALLGDVDAALSMSREAIRLSLRFNDMVEVARARAVLSEVVAAQGRFAEAASALRATIPVFEEQEQKRDLVWSYAMLGIVLQAQGHRDQARAVFTKAIELAGVDVPVP